MNSLISISNFRNYREILRFSSHIQFFLTYHSESCILSVFIYPDVLVAAVSQQRVGEATAVLPPGLIDLQDHSSQTSRPLLQELLTHCFEIAHHQVQDATVADVTEEEVVHILLFCRQKRAFMHQQPAEFCRTSQCHSYHIP